MRCHIMGSVTGMGALMHEFAVWQRYGLNDVYLRDRNQRNLIMRIAAIYDIHANLPALEAVLQEIRQENVDCVVVGGDVVPGPLPFETIQCLLGLDIPARFIRGNGDREVLAQMSGV